MASFPETVGEWLLDLLAFFGLGIGGGQAAASGLLNELQQDSMRAAAAGEANINGKQTRGKVLSPATLAEGVVKGWLPMQEATDEASFSGMSADRFDALVKITGNPPGPGELITMLRRGLITANDLEIGIREGYIKTEWAPMFLALQTEPLPVDQAVQAAVQNHLTYDIAATHATHSGVDAFDFDVMVKNAGNPPGPLQVLELWRRGDITEADVDQALRESRLKDKWIPALKLLMVRKLPQRTIAMLVGHGAMTDATATAKLRELGYTAEDAAFVVAAAHKTTAQHDKVLSVTQVVELYAARALSHDDAMADLQTIGYSPTNAAALLDLTDRKQSARFTQSAITRVRTLYVGHRIDKPEASTALDQLHVQADQRDQLLALWEIEATTNVRNLTEAQLAAAGRMGLLSPDEIATRFEAMGYDPADAQLLLVIGKVIPNPNQPTT